MRIMKTIRLISAMYGACCLAVVCALLVLMVVGTQSALGFNILLLFLVVFWSGVPLLLLSAHSLKSKEAPSRRAGVSALLASLAPAVIYLVGQLSSMPAPGAGRQLEHPLSLVLTFLPALISLALFLPVLIGGAHEAR